MTTLYKIDGKFVTWWTAHGNGYTLTPTEVVSRFKLTDPWGADADCSGYLDRHSSNDVYDWELWASAFGDWLSLDRYVQEYGLYPAFCIDTELTNGMSVSPAVYFENGDEVWYLIRDAANDGWIEENDLAARGWYQPAPPLPTVIKYLAYATSDAVSTINVASGSSAQLYSEDSHTAIPYDSSVCYSVYYWRGISSTGGYGCFEAINSSNYLYAKNIINATISGVYFFRYAVCSSSQATVITVYNSSNTAYNAFKYTANGTDYYYVLDGTQADWVVDLSSIGYSLTLKAWFNANKTAKQVTGSWSGVLYGNNGSYAQYDSSKTYSIVSVINSSGSQISVSTSQLSLYQDGSYLGFANNSGTTLYNAVYVEYAVS